MHTSARNQVRPKDHNARRARVLRRYHGVCYWCGSGGASHVDHVHEVADGGTYAEDNMRPIHKDCHREKTSAARRARAAGKPLRITLRD
ncbi:HNH endonuclease [Sciscionella sediminilitoris]|uniref:HNH endonuclease n=1 Tax=Sciscionella sediminilitoris TaxID=1445613 RepID=UPI0018D16227|nr:HNH endonuclease signature motif containing protein [Sciscionella sp. SE31]